LTKSTELNQEVMDSCKVVHAEWNELSRVWTLPVIHAIGLKEPARFNELKRRIEGISATSLPETPPRVEYTLTKKGAELCKLLEQFADWAKRWATVK